MRSDITPGQTSDYLGFDLVMDNNLPEPSVLLADRGYDSDNVRKTMEARNVVPVIPMRKTRKLRVAVDRKLYILRNLVERCFNKLKNARRVAARAVPDTRGEARAAALVVIMVLRVRAI
jgi:transposase